MQIYSEMPSSIAKLYSAKHTLVLNGVIFTYSYGHDEHILYTELNEELYHIETSLYIDNKKLASIERKLELFKLEILLKDEIFLRVKWLYTLYEVKEAIQSQSIHTREQAKSLLIKIAPTKIGALRTYLKQELQTLVNSLPLEKKGPIQLSLEQELIEKVQRERNEKFIDLGKVGQEYVIKEALHRYEDGAVIDYIKEESLRIFQIVNNIKNAKEPMELVKGLESLPLSVFSTLTSTRQDMIAKRLLEMTEWETFESLNRIVILLDKVITIEERKEEAQNLIQLNEGKQAFTIRIDKVNNGLIKIG